MDTDELTATLREAGLSPYQADAYVALLSLGSAAAGDLAAESGVPRPRIYDVVRDLETAGYVTTYEQDRLYVEAVPPNDLQPLREQVARLGAALDEIEQRYRTPATRESDVTLVTRFEPVFAQARRDIEAAERHVQAVLTPRQFRELHGTLAAAYDRGVYVQVSLYAPPEEVSLDTEEFAGVCTEVRRREYVAPFLVITDRHRVSYAPPRHTASEYGVVVADRWTAYVFHWFFLTSCWEMFETVHADPRDTPPITFVEITSCVRYVEERLHEGATVHVTVDGYSVRTGRHRTLSGTVVDVDYPGHHDDGDDVVASLAQLAARATLVVETPDGTVTVGGEGAMSEDVGADRIVVESVDM